MIKTGRLGRSCFRNYWGIDQMYNVSYDVAAIIIIIVLNIIHLTLYTMKDKGNYYYQVFLVLLFFNAVLDLITAYTFQGVIPVSDALNHLLNTAYLVYAVYTSLYAWKTIAAHTGVDHPFALRFNHILIGAYLVLLFLNFFNGWVFSFSGGVYDRGPLFPINYGVSVMIILNGAVILVKHRKKYRRFAWILNSSFVLIPLVFCAIQIITVSTLLTVFASALVALLMCFALETPDYQKILKLVEELQVSKEEETAAREEAQMANQAKSTFLAKMSHDIRTPMNAILGFNSMIARETREPQTVQYAEYIRSAGENLLAIINDILDLSKIESGKMELLEEEYDLKELIQNVTSMIFIKAQSKKLEIKYEIDPMLPRKLFGDPVRIRQILINILNNAVKYTEKGSVTLILSGEVYEKEVILHVCVKDTGIGIRPEDLPKLFESFERLDEKRNRNIEGTGLGMSIVSQLLKLMGSEVHVESVYGEGSAFSFDLKQQITDILPIGSMKPSGAEKPSTSSANPNFFAPDCKILVVDDNAVNRKLFRSLLAKTKLQIDEASDGLECLDLCSVRKYDLICLDHMMPELDGCETLIRMNETPDHLNLSTPKIMLTANALAGAREEYLKLGFRDFLSKPFTPAKLEEMILRYLPAEKVQHPEQV